MTGKRCKLLKTISDIGIDASTDPPLAARRGAHAVIAAPTASARRLGRLQRLVAAQVRLEWYLP
jgi:hypothetical protein